MVIRGRPPKHEFDKMYTAFGRTLVELQLAGFAPKYFDGELAYFTITPEFLEQIAIIERK